MADAQQLRVPVESIASVPAAAASRKKLNLAAVQNALFTNATVRGRIARDYSLGDTPTTASAFCARVIENLRQIPASYPLSQQRNNDQVFEAAVRAIGSNSRSWARYLKSEPELRKLLCDFEVERVSRQVESRRVVQEQVALLLGGITAKNDARAIMEWSDALARTPEYYSRIIYLANAISDAAVSLARCRLQDFEIMICVVSALAKPSSIGNRQIAGALRQFGPEPKLRGMGYVLASEFFRNLGWSGFKPDRHIKRLLEGWSIIDSPEVQNRVATLSAVLGTHDREFREYASYALRGVELTPNHCSYSVADNHIWLLGAYVERKNRETKTSYLDGY